MSCKQKLQAKQIDLSSFIEIICDDHCKVLREVKQECGDSGTVHTYSQSYQDLPNMEIRITPKSDNSCIKVKWKKKNGTKMTALGNDRILIVEEYVPISDCVVEQQ